MTTATLRQNLELILERQISDETRLRRVVALFQRSLGEIFGNAMVRRRNRRYEVDLAVYETPIQGGQSYRMPRRQIIEWIRQAAHKAHPRLYKRLKVDVSPWESGHASHKLYAPVKIYIEVG
jgi:hypothetical protein